MKYSVHFLITFNCSSLLGFIQLTEGHFVNCKNKKNKTNELVKAVVIMCG